MKIDFLITPVTKTGTFVKNLLFIDYENQVLTTAERKYKKQKSDLKINLDRPKDCIAYTIMDIAKYYKIIENLNCSKMNIDCKNYF